MREICSFTYSDLPPELRLILACLRLTPNEKEAQQIEGLSQSEIAWPDFLRWVDRHRVAPLVYQNLRRYGGNGVPSSVMSALRSRFESNAHRGLANARELARLYQLFQENGLACIPLKGSILALQVYGNLALRHAGDIDLLVHPRHVGQTDLLLQQTYQRTSPGPHLTPCQEKQFYRLREELTYIHEKNKIKLDLHTRLLYNKPYFAQDLTGLQDRARDVPVANSLVPAISPEDNFLYLSDHGGQHYWERLFWLHDLAEIIRQNLVPDWDLLMMVAAEKGVSRPVAQGVILAHLLLQTPLPEAIKIYAGRDRMIIYLVKAALKRICTRQKQTPSVMETLDTNVFYIPRLYSEVKYKIEVMKRVLFYSGDWGTIRLPDIIFPFFFIIRPFLWFYRRLRRR